MPQTSKTLVIFDIDGTLLFSNKIDSLLFAQAFQKRFGFELPTLDWNNYPHCTDTSILATLFKNERRPQPPATEMEAFKDEYVALLEQGRLEQPEDFMEVPGAKKMVDYLQAHSDFLVGIGTGGFKKPAMVKLKHVGIDTSDLHMAFADGNVSREDILGEALQKVEDKHPMPNRVVYIGDAIWDVQTTRNMDIPFIGIRHRNDQEVLLQAGASHVISNYLDQEHFLQLLKQASVPTISV